VLLRLSDFCDMIVRSNAWEKIPLLTVLIYNKTHMQACKKKACTIQTRLQDQKRASASHR